MSRYITENERYKIETMLEDGFTPKQIAERIGKHYTTVYREIKRGTVLLRDGRTWLDKPVYCADAGQRLCEERGHNKGIYCKITNADYLRRAAYYIKDCRYSPYSALTALKKEFPDTGICKTTMYSYVYQGFFDGVSRASLPYKKSPSRKAQKPRRPSLRMRGAKTIEDRPKAVCDRNLYGDWEMDTVVGAKGKGKECLLVLTERATRKEIVRKIKNRQKETVVNELDKIELEMGYTSFSKTFRTITCDNGVEFSDYAGLEKSFIHPSRIRTQVYFCHPYCSGERGSNENNNKLIRRFIPKGSLIKNFTEEYIKYIENWINNYPRKMFNGYSANEVYNQLTIP